MTVTAHTDILEARIQIPQNMLPHITLHVQLQKTYEKHVYAHLGTKHSGW